MTQTAISRAGVPIRLQDERWAHIVDEHGELEGKQGDVLQTISQAEHVLEGEAGEFFAVRMVQSDRALVVVYRELSAEDGFVITAFLTSQATKLFRRTQVWPPRT